MEKLKFIDLFCGIGGFHQALKNIDFECVFACDIDSGCRATYENNYKIKPENDITKLDIKKIPPFDILCAGFPCQTFSKAGKREGFEDTRGTLFFNVCKIAEFHLPKYMILENVRNLSSHDNGNTWKVIYDSLNSLGYLTYEKPVILNVTDFNIPQNRERVIIMCIRKDFGTLPELPVLPKNSKNNLTQFIENYLETEEKTDKYKITGKLKDVETIWNQFIKILLKNSINMPKYPLWTDSWDIEYDGNNEFYKKYKSWIDKNQEFYETNKAVLFDWLTLARQNKNWNGAVRKFEWQAGTLEKDDSMNTVLWTARGSGIRVKRCTYIPTLVAMSMIPIYGPHSRKLTPKELLKLQSFPDTFVFDEKKIYKQVGNAVNVKMIERSARFLILNENLF